MKHIAALVTSVFALIGIGSGLANATGPSRRDPQHKFGVYLEQCSLQQSGVTGDLPVQLYVALDGNDFAVVSNNGQSGFLLDLTLPDSATTPGAPALYEFGDDSACTGNAREVQCHTTENVYFVGNSTPFVLGLNWEFAQIDGEAFGAYQSHDEIGNGARCTNQIVADHATCVAALGKMRAFFAENNVHPKMRIDNGLCN